MVRGFPGALWAVVRGSWRVLVGGWRLVLRFARWLWSLVGRAGGWLKSKAAKEWRFVWGVFACPPFDSSPRYIEACEWHSNYTPAGEKDERGGYDAALEYAWRRYEQACDAETTLDKKANNLLRNASIIAGLLGLGLGTLKLTAPAMLLPSLALFTLSMAMASIACNPTVGATSASVKDLLDDIAESHMYANWDRNALVAGSIHCAITGKEWVCEWKANRIRASTLAFVGALFFFALPVAMDLLGR